MTPEALAELTQAQEELAAIEAWTAERFSAAMDRPSGEPFPLTHGDMAEILRALALFARLSGRLAGGAGKIASNPMLAQMMGMFGL